MPKVLAPITLRAASLTLTGSLATVVGTVATDNADATSGAIRLGSMVAMRLACNYARAGGSTTGRPRFSVDLSMDSPDTAPASVSNWFPVMLLDNSSFTAGAIDGFAMAVSQGPSVTGTSVSSTPPIDVRGAQWARVRVLDVDGVAPGTIASLVMGGET